MANGKTLTSVMAIGRSGNWCRVVEVHGAAGRFQIKRFFTCEVNGKGLSQIVADLVAAGWGRRQADEGPTPVVAVFEGESVVYRHIEVPAKGDKDLESIVRMQAEAVLPLPPDDMEIAWREGRVSNNKRQVTIAATRTSSIKGFADEAASLRPARIVLECDGFARAWSEACRGTSARTLVVRLKAHGTDVCLVDGSLLSQAARIDVGLDDLLKGQVISVPEAERLKWDIEGAAELFGLAKETPIYIVSDGSAAIAEVVRYLTDSGMTVRPSVPRGWAAQDGTAVAAAELYQYMAEAGAAMLALEGTQELDIFSRLYRPADEQKEAHAGIPLRKAVSLVAAAAVVTLLGWYGIDKMALKKTERLLGDVREGVSVTSMLEEHKAINETAAERPDMLEVFTILKESSPEDVTFHSFTFRKDKPVSVTGQARTNDSLYKLEAALRTKKGISNVKEQSAVKDDRENKIVFTITFDYRNFTKGQSEPLAVFGR